MTAQERISSFMHDNPGLDRIELLFPDMNGVMRGKWLPASSAEKLLSDGAVRLPVSTYALDIFGEDVDATGLAAPMGDPDGYGFPVPETLAPVPWSDNAAQIIMDLHNPDGSECLYNPRQLLAAQVARLSEAGLTAVVATELEFYIFKQDTPGATPVPPTGLEGAQVYDLAVVSALEPLLSDIRAFCTVQGIPADTLIAEYGPGQFEINFNHVHDALAAADYAVLFKRLVRETARKHGYGATFMAKPYGDPPGSGMHVHVSLLDKDGTNIFSADDGLAAPLTHAISGLLGTIQEMQAVFAPHANSYRRFQPGSYAPVSLTWGMDHRGVAVRVPATKGEAARLEHRICGADVNPYLALAAILGGIARGLEHKSDPGAPLLQGDGSDGARLYHDWTAALDAFEHSEAAKAIFGAEYVRVYTACRRHENACLSTMITDAEYKTYLHKL